MLIEANAKINWSLDITGVREDGYHLMDMLMQPVSLCDDITLTLSDSLTLTTSGYPRLPADEHHLAFRAAKALLDHVHFKKGASIHVHKRIPVGAGMGGGSADAAAVLIGLQQLWQLDLSESELYSIALTLGADVPFCIHGGLTRTTGIGENLLPVSCAKNYWLVVIQPCPGLSTGKIFTAWKDSCVVHPDTDSAMYALQTGNITLLFSSLGNVLQPVSESFQPEIAEAISALHALGAGVSLMTGSGSAVFGVFLSAPSARNALVQLRKRWSKIWMCHTCHDSIRIVHL